MDEKILELLKEVQPVFDFGEDVDFIEQGFLDSFDIITLVSELEEAFNVLISALEIVPENFATVATIRKLVERSEKRES